jgi:hypothetical protein
LFKSGPFLPTVKIEDRLLVLSTWATSEIDLHAAAKGKDWTFEPPEDVAEAWIAIEGNAVRNSSVLRFGVRLVPMHIAIAAAAGLPEGWRQAQTRTVAQVLEPLRVGGERKIAKLYLAHASGKNKTEASRYIEERGLSWNRPDGSLRYLVAEAGKGKSTLLAQAAETGHNLGKGPLPAFIPLRLLSRGGGAGWPRIARDAGASNPERLARAIRAGLVTPFLDGLDEVSGKYDPALVRDVVQAVQEALLTPHARVFLSGRTTEASHFDTPSSVRLRVELPNTNESAFRDYADAVSNVVLADWQSLAERVPTSSELGLDDALEQYDGSPASETQRSQVLQWVEHTFDDLGKERSLFFVQSLTFLARSYQINGNRALVINQPGESTHSPKLAEARVYDACALAVALACVREQGKVDDESRSFFTPEAQIDVLTAFAILASAPVHLQSDLPRPNEAVVNCTKVDPILQAEPFLAMLRQMQKHALLIAIDGAAGEWSPNFLSEWARAFLLVRAWQLAARNEAVAGIPANVVREAIANASDGRLAFGVMFPEILESKKEVETIASVMRKAIESADAAANLVYLAASTDLHLKGPLTLPTFTDITSLRAEGLVMDDVTAYVAFAGDSIFDGCEISLCGFDACDFPGAVFTNCTFESVDFRECSGPMIFDGCTFSQCQWIDTTAPTRPPLHFSDCTFDEQCLISQDKPVSPEDSFQVAAAIFVNCQTKGDPDSLLTGMMAKPDSRLPEGIVVLTDTSEAPPSVQAVRSVLRTFFPDWRGDGQPPQARPYIRSSALGRGAVPDGMPSNAALVTILHQEGFSDGGRDNHVYAPWSQVGGKTKEGLDMRNAYVDYLMNGRSNAFIDSLRDRLMKAAGWSS